MKKFHGLSLSLSADAGIQKVLVDEGSEDPNTTKAPASETPFDGLGSSREH